jgi:hypothetical protein
VEPKAKGKNDNEGYSDSRRDKLFGRRIRSKSPAQDRQQVGDVGPAERSDGLQSRRQGQGQNLWAGADKRDRSDPLSEPFSTEALSPQTPICILVCTRKPPIQTRTELLSGYETLMRSHRARCCLTGIASSPEGHSKGWRLPN